ARKNALLPSEQSKSFRSSLSPVNEASPDQDTAPPCVPLPPHLSIRPVTHRAPSPFRKGKPFALKVTEQWRIAEHVRLTTSSAMPLLHKPGAPETPQQPEGTGSHLPSPSNPSVSIFPQPPPSSTPSQGVPEVTYVTKVNAHFHSVKPPRAKTPTPNPTQGTVSHEDKRPSSPAPQINSSEPSPEQTPSSLKDNRDIPKPSASSTPWRKAHPATAAPAQAAGSSSTSTDTMAEHITEPQLTPSSPNTSHPPKAEPAPSSGEAAKPPGSGASGWHRLKKHLMVQPEATSFPESKPEKAGQEEGNKEDAAQAVVKQDCLLVKSRAMRMWDAILYQVTLPKERKQQAEEKLPQKQESFSLPRRLPILLHKPRFDARKLKELAAKPMTKMSTVFELSLFRPKGAEEHSKNFNRTASGWSVN
uniref:Proline rich 33 n=1 Tax=Malurus cyaneus samueli TaxID=2593467 RepID=A0A8C5TW96_9PASS